MEQWTIAAVKVELPNVKVRIGKKVVTGRISGRLKQFATVSITNTGTLHNNSHMWIDREVAWETLVHCLNANRPVIF